MVLVRVAEDLKDVATIDSPPRMEGRTMSMTLAPAKVKVVPDGKADEKVKRVEATEADSA